MIAAGNAEAGSFGKGSDPEKLDNGPPKSNKGFLKK
jgi:hypothetical protein